MGFDIDTLSDFRVPRHLCDKCAGIWRSVPRYREYENLAICNICGFRYIADPGENCGEWSDLLDWQTEVPKLRNALKHARRLTLPAWKWSRGGSPPLAMLLDALGMSRLFVHFVSFGLSHQLLGALKLASRKTVIRGVVANAEDSVMSDVREHSGESRSLFLTFFGPENEGRNGSRNGRLKEFGDLPHQKLIIIDGLLAFKGSANLTMSGWRKAAMGREIIEVVTDIDEVWRLNNTYFSPLWAERSRMGEFDNLSDSLQCRMEPRVAE